MTDTPRDQDDPKLEAEEQEFSDEHPLASPNELAGSADAGIKLEFAAREIANAEDAGVDPQPDAQGAASGIDYEEDTLPLEGE